MKDRHRQSGLTALDLLEEAVHLLRTAPASALAWYGVGAMPFVLVLLYFWADMSWSADARRDCAVKAMFVALGFVWMKFCQAVFARRLGAQLKLEPAARMSIQSRLRVLFQQAILQPSKLFVLPIALLLTLPFAWICAFYENMTAFGDARNVRALCARSWKQAKLWPRQNHLVLSMSVLLSGIVFANLLLVVLLAPHLVKMFTGLENVFTRSGLHVFNSTILAVAAALTYVCCDPLLKAVYVLRCFYGESLQSGEDLQVELRRIRAKATAIAAVLLICGATSICGATPAAGPSASINAQELDESISETIAKPEFSWRMPREQLDASSKDKSPNLVDRFLRRTFHAIGKWWRALLDWIDRVWPKPTLPLATPNTTGGMVSRNALEICLGVLITALVLLLAMKIRDRILQSRAAAPQPRRPQHVDLTEESVMADQLPEDEWLRMARELIAAREWRLALRALFLAGLAHLSQRGVIALARHKSNRDYQAELLRRAPVQIALHDAFARNLREVERVWYGRHEVDLETVETFQSNLETIRAT
jgi:Domain of unknown function (DUF4129)